jgi:hypothetical protein
MVTVPLVKRNEHWADEKIGIAYSARQRGRLKLLANRVVEMGILDSISDHGIGDLLKKTTLSHGCRNNGA